MRPPVRAHQFVATLIGFVALAPSPRAHAQQDDNTIELIAAEVLQADSLHDWRMLLGLAHPAALTAYRHDQLQIFTMQDLPLPGEVSPCFLKQMKQYGRFLLDTVFHVPSADSLARLAPESVFAGVARFSARVSPRRAAVDSFLPTRKIVGHVLANDSTAYVVLEEQYTSRLLPEPPETQVQVMTLRRYRGTWRSMLDPDLGESVGGAMVSMEGCK